jgi:hypothetical protein
MTNNNSSKELVTTAGFADVYIGEFKVHDDIKNLLWFGDGKYKNITKEQMMTDSNAQSFMAMGGRVKFTVYIHTGDEPSLLYENLPIILPDNISIVQKPDYFPKYQKLTPEQRGVYINLLSNPYNTEIDIGYVFLLYYGLERHLVQGDFDSAFKVILKLRDVHKNKSFQYYSGNALILSALIKNKGDYIPLFLNSLDKEHEYNFDDNLLLMCYYSFDVLLQPKDIMRMAKTFGFTNNNYIKKNPDIFLECLSEITGEINIKSYINDSEIKKLNYGNKMIYANTSIVNNMIEIPFISEKLQKDMLNFLKKAHDMTKLKMAEKRKRTD